MGADNTIALILQAHDEASAQLAKGMETISRATGQLRGQLGPTSQEVAKVDTNLAQATRTVRVLSVGLLSELNPALGQMVVATSAAAGATRTLPLAWSGAAVGLAAAVTAISIYVHRAEQLADAQAKVNLAVRGLDAQTLRTQMQAISEQLERLNVESPVNKLRKFGEALTSILDRIFGGKATFETDRLQKQLGETGEALVKVLPVERQIRMADAVIREQQARQGLLQVLLEQADLEANEARVVELRQRMAQTISNEASAEETRLRAQADQRRAQAVARGAPAEEIKAIFEELDKDIGTLADRAGARFEALMESVKQRILQIRERRLLPVADLSEVERFERPPTPAEIERGRQAVVQADERELVVARDLVSVRREAYGLSQAQQAALDLQLIAAEKAVELEAAKGSVAKENLALTREYVRTQSVIQRELERTDFVTGLRRGLQDTREGLESWGQAGQQVIREFATNSQRYFSDLLFVPLERGWKKALEEVPRQLAMSTLRQLTDLFGRFATGQLLGGSGSFLAGVAAFLGLGGGGAVVTAAQAAALQAQGIPVGLSSTGQFVVMGAGGGAGGAAGGGFQLPGLPLGMLPQPTWLQNFLAMPIAGGALSGIFAAPAGGTIATEAAALGIGAGGLGPAGLTFGQLFGGAGGALGLGFTIFAALQGPPTAMNIATSGISGALSGAMLGSVIPGVGTVVGGIAGGLLGAGAGFFGKGGGKKKGPSTAQKSAMEAEAAKQPFANAVQAATSLEELVGILNKQWAPFPRQFYLQAGPTVWTLGAWLYNKPEWLFTVDKLLDAEVVDQIQVFAGASGVGTEDAQLSSFVKQKVRELAQHEATAVFGVEETLGGGAISRLTFRPVTRLKEAAGQNLLISQALLKAAGWTDDEIEQLIRRLLAVDKDRQLGVFDVEEFVF